MFRLLCLGLILFFTVITVQAQESEGISAEINVSANVVQTIELVTVNSMYFGNVQPGQKEIYVNPVNSLNAAFLIAIGTPEAEFRLTYLSEHELTHADGNGSLTFTYEISANSVENQSTSELLNNDSRNMSFNDEGRHYIWVGGRVSLEKAQPGSYEGDFTIEIDYI